MAARLRRRQVLYLGMASLGTALAGGAVVRSMQGSPPGTSPAGAPRLLSTAGALELDLVAEHEHISTLSTHRFDRSIYPQLDEHIHMCHFSGIYPIGKCCNCKIP